MPIAASVALVAMVTGVSGGRWRAEAAVTAEDDSGGCVYRWLVAALFNVK